MLVLHGRYAAFQIGKSISCAHGTVIVIPYSYYIRDYGNILYFGSFHSKKLNQIIDTITYRHIINIKDCVTQF